MFLCFSLPIRRLAITDIAIADDYVTVLRSQRGACGVMVIAVEYGHREPSSNPGWDCLFFTQR